MPEAEGGWIECFAIHTKEARAIAIRKIRCEVYQGLHNTCAAVVGMTEGGAYVHGIRLSVQKGFAVLFKKERGDGLILFAGDKNMVQYRGETFV